MKAEVRAKYIITKKHGSINNASAVFFCLKIFFVRENYNSNFPQFYVYQTCMN